MAVATLGALLASAAAAHGATASGALASHVALRIDGASGTLDSGQSSSMYAIVYNRTALTVHAGPLYVVHPSGLTIRTRGRAIAVRPNVPAVLPVSVEAGARLEPGRKLLLFELPVQARRQRAKLIGSREVQVGIAGVDAVLTVFGVPSFLLVPGFIVLGACAAFWRLRLFRPEADTGEFPFGAATPEFWVLAITMSGLIVWAWGLPQRENPLLHAYGLRDVLEVWVASLALAFVLYTAAVLGRRAWLARRTPKSGDSPIAILRKLARQKLTIERELVTVVSQDGDRHLLRLQADTARARTWLGPRIEFKWHGDGFDQALADALKHHLDETRDPAAIAKLLKHGTTRGKLTVDWEGANNSPCLVPSERITPEAVAGIVREAA